MNFIWLPGSVCPPRSLCPPAARGRPSYSRGPSSKRRVRPSLLRGLVRGPLLLPPPWRPCPPPSIVPPPGALLRDAAAAASLSSTQARVGLLKTLLKRRPSCFACAKQAKGSALLLQQAQGSAKAPLQGVFTLRQTRPGWAVAWGGARADRKDARPKQNADLPNDNMRSTCYQQ